MRALPSLMSGCWVWLRSVWLHAFARVAGVGALAALVTLSAACGRSGFDDTWLSTTDSAIDGVTPDGDGAVTDTRDAPLDETGDAIVTDTSDAPLDETGDAIVDSGLDGPPDGADAPGDVSPETPTLTTLVVVPSSATVALSATQQFNATAYYSDGSSADVTTTATWSSDTTSVVTIDVNGVATAKSAGAARITAGYSGLTATADVVVSAATVVSLQVNPSTATTTVGGSVPFHAIATLSDGSTLDVTATATWTSSSAATASITGGTATGVAGGTATITASYSGLTASGTLTVTTPVTVTAIDISPFSPKLAIGGRVSLTATAVYSDGTKADVTLSADWTSGSPAIATVGPKGSTNVGTVTGVSAGDTVVSAVFSGVTGTTPITVAGATPTSLTVAPTTATLAPGANTTLTATETLSDGTKINVTTTATWTTSDGTVAIVAAGVVTAEKAGTATITVSIAGLTATATITVSAATLVSLTVSPTGATVPKGSSTKFTATGKYSDGSTRDLTSTVVWSVGTASVASVSNVAGSNGTATGLAVGSSSIIATIGSISAKGTLTVTGATLIGVKVSPNPVNLVQGDKTLATATASYSDGTSADVTASCTWSTDSTTVANVSNGTGSQ
ncbi:MAG: Ig domain-containing protein, partial [Polyangiales bacterium]